MNEAAAKVLRAADDLSLVRVLREESDPARREAAATELFGRYQRRIYIWCLRMVRDHDRALDLAQDVQLSAFRGLDSFRENARFSSWLFAIARNRCLSALRPVSLLRDEEAELDRIEHPDRGADQVLEEDEAARGLLALMDECLEPLERRALTLRCFERVPVDEITERLGLTTSSGARGLLQKARRKLRAALATREGEGTGSP